MSDKTYMAKRRHLKHENNIFKTENPVHQPLILSPIAWLISFPILFFRHLKIKKINMEGLKTPYLLLSTHMCFDDFKVLTLGIWPHRANYVVAIDGFLGISRLLNLMGGISKRKFTNDTSLIKKLHYSLYHNKAITVIYPEARYSLSGTTAILPESLGKMVKMFKVPVVVMRCHGHYLGHPFWSKRKRSGFPYFCEMEQVLTQQAAETESVDNINNIITQAFQYDEWKWQKDNNIIINDKHRAEGLHRVLYHCPHCGVESRMNTQNHLLTCEACGKQWELTELGELHALNGETEFSHVPDWYEWERQQVRNQIEKGEYLIECEARLHSLPNPLGFIDKGNIILRHDINGFTLKGKLNNGEDFSFFRNALENYSVHIEYNYKNRGDCIDVSDINHTYFIYPSLPNVITKIHFGTEELFKFLREQQGK